MSTAGSVIIRSHSGNIHSDSDDDSNENDFERSVYFTPRPLRDLFSPLSIEEMFTRPSPAPRKVIESTMSPIIGVNNTRSTIADIKADDSFPSFFHEQEQNGGGHRDDDEVASSMVYLEGVSQIISHADVEYQSVHNNILPQATSTTKDLPATNEGEQHQNQSNDDSDEHHTMLVDFEVPLQVTEATTESNLRNMASFDVSVMVMSEDLPVSSDNEDTPKLLQTQTPPDNEQSTNDELSTRLIGQSSQISDMQTVIDADNKSNERQVVSTSFKFDTTYQDSLPATPCQKSTFRDPSKTPRGPPGSGRQPRKSSIGKKLTPRISRSLSPVKHIRVQERFASILPQKSIDQCILDVDNNQENTVKLFQLHYDTTTRERLSALVSELDCADIGAISALEDEDGLSVGMKRLKLSEVSFILEPKKSDVEAQEQTENNEVTEKSNDEDEAQTVVENVSVHSEEDESTDLAHIPITVDDSHEISTDDVEAPLTQKPVRVHSPVPDVVVNKTPPSKSLISKQMMKALASVEAAMNAPMLSTVMEDSRELEELYAASVLHSKSCQELVEHFSKLTESVNERPPPIVEAEEQPSVEQEKNEDSHQEAPLFGGTVDLPPTEPCESGTVSRSISHGSTETAINIGYNRAPPFLIKHEDLEDHLPRQMGSMIFDPARGLWVRQTTDSEDPFHAISEDDASDATPLDRLRTAMASRSNLSISQHITEDSIEKSDGGESNHADDESYSQVDDSVYTDDEDGRTYDDTAMYEQSMVENEKLAYFHQALKNLKIEAAEALGWPQKSIVADEQDSRAESPVESVKNLMRLLNVDAPNSKTIAANLTDCDLDSLYGLSDIFPNLESLDCSNNSILFLGGIPSSVRQLTAQLNKLSKLTMFEHLERLTVLDISHNKMVDLSLIEKLPHLTELVARDCLVEAMPSRSSNLKKLNVRSHCMTSFCFESYPQLVELDMSHGTLHTLTVCKDGLPALNTLKIENNKMRQIEIDGSLPSLKLLEASDNQLTALDFAKFAKIQSLDVSYNTQLQLSDDFAVMPCLQNLIIGGCNLRELPKHLSIACPALDTLDASDNKLVDIFPLRKCFNLKTLNVAENQISSLGLLAKVVKRIPTLTALNVLHNPLTQNFYPGERICRDSAFMRKLSDAAFVQLLCYRSSIIRLLKGLNELDTLPVSDRDRKVAESHYLKLKSCLNTKDTRSPLVQSRSMERSNIKFWVDLSGGTTDNRVTSSIPKFAPTSPPAYPLPPVKTNVHRQSPKQPQSRRMPHLMTPVITKRTLMPAKEVPNRGTTKCYIYSADGRPMVLERR